MTGRLFTKESLNEHRKRCHGDLARDQYLMEFAECVEEGRPDFGATSLLIQIVKWVAERTAVPVEEIMLWLSPEQQSIISCLEDETAQEMLKQLSPEQRDVISRLNDQKAKDDDGTSIRDELDDDAADYDNAVLENEVDSDDEDETKKSIEEEKREMEDKLALEGFLQQLEAGQRTTTIPEETREATRVRNEVLLIKGKPSYFYLYTITNQFRG